MEFKWVMIAAAVMFSGMFAGLGYSEHTKSQCKIEGIRSGMTVEAIVKICGSTR